MGDISHLFGNEVPYPHSHYYSNEYSRMVYCWYIDGFFHTQKNVRFINDIIARFKITADCQLHSFKNVTVDNINPIKLKAFQGLKSLSKAKLEDLNVNTYINSDYVYTCIVLQAERFIKNDGMIIYQTLENWAFENFIDLTKDKSTLRAKCRNCYNWYFDRQWALYHTVRIKKNKELVLASRVEHARNMARKKEIENTNKIKNAITGLMADAMFKKKNGTWNSIKIAEYLKLDSRTVRKYLAELPN